MDFAVEAVKEAGRLTLDWFQSSTLEAKSKADGSPVTQADIAVETLLRQRLGERFPGDEVIGEEIDDEDGEKADNAARTWVIDPIDGTKAFVQGVPLYATLLAMVDHDGPAVGVIYLPGLDECVWAGRGLGAFWNGSPCRVSDTATLDGAYVCTSGLSYWPETALSKVREAGARVRTWGDAYGYALVATGRAAAMIDPQCANWDVAAMPVIMAEAGGRFSNTSGKPDWENGSALGTNSAVHDELLSCFS